MANFAEQVWEQITDKVAGRMSASVDLIKAAASEGGGKKGGSKAQGAPGDGPIPPKGPAEEMHALLSDPFTLLETLGYRERHTGVSYDTLLQLSHKVPIFPGIMQTRLNQLSNFSRAQPDVNQTGFAIQLRNGDQTPLKKDKIRMRDMEEWVTHSGGVEIVEKGKKRIVRHGLDIDSFTTFLKKIGRDSLTYDQSPFECRLNSHGVPVEYHAVDGATIRIADTEWEDDWRKRDKQVRYVQVYDNTVIGEFTPEQLCFGVRNPRSDLRCNGYGFSELEMGVHLITSLLFAYQYNSKFFSQGSVAKGMLNVPGVPDKKLRAFSQQWHMIASGILNAWRTPITNFQDAQWIDFHQNNREMEFNAWMDWITKVFTAICGMDPEEINFSYGNTGQSSQMFSSPAETKVKHSKDKGLLPLLNVIQDWLNRYLIWRIDPDYQLVFTGLNPREAGQVADVETKQVKYLKRVGELRAENDMPKPEKGSMEEELESLILDPGYIQAWTMLRQERMEQEQGGAEGGEEEPQGPGEADWGGAVDDARGGGEDGPEDEGGTPGGPSEEHWEGMMNDMAGKAMKGGDLKKAGPLTVEYEIDL